MYKIIKDGAIVAMTEQLNFIKKEADGVFYACTESEAQGIAVNNTAYNLLGREEMAECETVIAVKVDGGACILEGENNQTETDALIVDLEYRMALYEMGVSE